MHKIDEKISLSLSVDLRAKVIRTKSLMDNLCQGRNPESVKFDRRDIMEAQRKYQGEIVICTYDKKCYSVMDLDFDNSPASLPVQGTGMSHAEYFKERKGIDLRYPNTAPIIVVLGRNNRKIFLPAELVCANELDPMVKQKLPMIASFTPPERHQAIEEIRKYLVPGAQKTKGVGGGLLPALGIVVEDKRIKVPVEVLPLPLLMAAGVNIPKEKGNMWAPIISRADYRVDRNRAVEMNVVVVHHDSLRNNVPMIYEKIRDLVNKHNSHYRFSESPYGLISASNDDEHCKAVQGYFRERLPDNMFVLDLVKPPRRQALDAAYSVVKYLLTKNGYLSQFLNFNTHDHANARDQKASRKSITILQGLARQILSKCGARIWWVSLPREIKLPCVFVGVDVFHSPRKYSVIEGKKIAKASVAAVVVQIVRSHEESENTHTEIFSQTFQRERGNEMGLGDSIKTTVSSALRIFNVNPMSCVMWRDGVGDPAIKQVAKEEIPSLREALNRGNPNAAVPLSYLVVQKRISTKFLSVDGSSAIPLGSLVTKLQGPEYYTFYINGTSPPYSTPKPARFVIAEKDEKLELSNKTIADLSWALCHDYSNWTGAIKLPSPVQCAHKLAELAGLMENGGDEIDVERFAGKAHFL
jgi:aubergine-like protein